MTVTIISAGTDPINANCYLTLSEAETYFSGRFDHDAWDNLDDDAKSRLLITASRRIDCEKFAGIKQVQLNAMQWPRMLIYNMDGYPIPQSTLPKELKYAVCEQAFFYIDELSITTLPRGTLELFSSYDVASINLTPNKGTANLLCLEARNWLARIGTNAWLSPSNPLQGTVSFYR